MPWSAVAAGIAAGGSLIGGASMNRRAARVAREQMAFQAQQQQIAMQFGERMSSTAHQRQVADLRAAGLNPILAAHGGASAPSVGMGSGAMPQLVDPIGGATEAGVSTAMAARAHRQELRNQRQQGKNLKEEEELIRAREYEASAAGHRQYQEANRIRTEIETLLPAQLEKLLADRRLADSNSALNIARLPREQSISRLFSSPLATPLAAAIIGGAALTPMRGLVHFRRAGPTAKQISAGAKDLYRRSRGLKPLNRYPGERIIVKQK